MQREPQPIASFAKLYTETYRYLWHRVVSLWPELLVACCIGLAVFSWGHHFAVRPTLNMAHDTLMGNVLLLHMTALAPRGVDGPVWYLSALLLSSAVLYLLFRRYGHSPVWVVMALVLLGYILVADSKSPTLGFDGVRQWMGWTYKGNLRALAELALGASLYPLVQFLLRQRVTQVLSVALTMLKWGCYCVAVLYCLRPSGHLTPITLVAWGCALVLCFSRLCADRDWYQRRWILWFGRFSLPPISISHLLGAQFGSHIALACKPLGKTVCVQRRFFVDRLGRHASCQTAPQLRRLSVNGAESMTGTKAGAGCQSPLISAVSGGAYSSPHAVRAAAVVSNQAHPVVGRTVRAAESSHRVPSVAR